jgi:hypothetical protein
LTGGPELLHNGAREEDSKKTAVGGQEERKEGKGKLCSMDMVVFDCEDEEESRPAATGDDAFNFGCLDSVDCIMYLVDSPVLRIQGRKEGIIGLGIAIVLVGEDSQWYALTMTG